MDCLACRLLVRRLEVVVHGWNMMELLAARIHSWQAAALCFEHEGRYHPYLHSMRSEWGLLSLSGPAMTNRNARSVLRAVLPGQLAWDTGTPELCQRHPKALGRPKALGLTSVDATVPPAALRVPQHGTLGLMRLERNPFFALTATHPHSSMLGKAQ